jgi:hypothetical protein
MANIVIYNPSVTPKVVLEYLESVNTPDYSSRPDVLVNPDITALVSVPRKYWKVVGSAVLEMTSTEKSNLDGFETAQLIAQQKAMAKALHEQVDSIGRLIRAIAKLSIDENNIAYKWLRDFKAAVANATSLADLKLSVGALPNTPDRTYAQGKTAIENLVDGE